MSNTGRNPPAQPLRPKLASTNSSRSPITPRVTARSTPTARSEPPTVRVKQSSYETPTRDVLGNGNITPRSSVRSSKINTANNTPTQTDTTPIAASLRPSTAAITVSDRPGGVIGNGTNGLQSRAAVGRPKSIISDSGSVSKGSLRLSPALLDHRETSPADATIESRFFHASDASKQEPAPKRPEPKKTPSFFYADGQREERPRPDTGGATSPAISAMSEQRPMVPWIRPDSRPASSTASPPAVSPGLSVISQASSFFPNASGSNSRQRPPSPTKENIHLSYRKGASQIFGTRPLPTTGPTHDGSPLSSGHRERSGSLEPAPASTPHRKSPSLSSIDSGSSPPSQRRLSTTADIIATPSPLTQELKPTPPMRVLPPLNELPSINTSLEQPDLTSPPPESTRSPTKSTSELAADARRERKVLDLEISNSSLLAINSSLERELRKQKAELKRFRRLSRAGRFSFGPGERAARLSEGLSAVGEEDEDGMESEFGFPSGGMTDQYDDYSDDDESAVSSTGLTSPSIDSRRESDRLAKDEKRLRVDLERHKELLVQSQMMNQTIKRCVYATEEMIQEGKKALDYHVRVSDVKLGGRVLSNHGEEEEGPEGIGVSIEVDSAAAGEGEGGEIEGENPTLDAEGMDQAQGFMDVWAGLGRPSYASSDRDSGIEVEKSSAVAQTSLPFTYVPGNADSGRPPDALSTGAALS